MSSSDLLLRILINPQEKYFENLRNLPARKVWDILARCVICDRRVEWYDAGRQTWLLHEICARTRAHIRSLTKTKDVFDCDLPKDAFVQRAEWILDHTDWELNRGQPIQSLDLILRALNSVIQNDNRVKVYAGFFRHASSSMVVVACDGYDKCVVISETDVASYEDSCSSSSSD